MSPTKRILECFKIYKYSESVMAKCTNFRHVSGAHYRVKCFLGVYMVHKSNVLRYGAVEKYMVLSLDCTAIAQPVIRWYTRPTASFNS